MEKIHIKREVLGATLITYECERNKVNRFSLRFKSTPFEEVMRYGINNHFYNLKAFSSKLNKNPNASIKDDVDALRAYKSFYSIITRFNKDNVVLLDNYTVEHTPSIDEYDFDKIDKKNIDDVLDIINEFYGKYIGAHGEVIQPKHSIATIN